MEEINHPERYGNDTYSPINVIEAWNLGFHLGNVIKYIGRLGKKDAPLQELKKARWYLDRKIKELEDDVRDNNGEIR